MFLSLAQGFDVVHVCFLGFLSSFGGFRHEDGSPDRQLVEEDDGKGERDLAQWVGRREDGGDDDGDENGVASFFCGAFLRW